MIKPNINARVIVAGVLTFLIIFSAAFLIYQKAIPKVEPMSAVVSIGGIDICIIDLSKDTEPYDIDLGALFGVNVVLEVQNHQVHFKSSNCPDQICVHAGWQGRDMDIAVCMPNQVSVVVMPTADISKR